MKIFILLSLLFQYLPNPSVSVNRNYALASVKDSTKFGRDEKGIHFPYIRQVSSVLANQQLIIRNVLMESESSLTSDTIKMNFDK